MNALVHAIALPVPKMKFVELIQMAIQHVIVPMVMLGTLILHHVINPLFLIVHLIGIVNLLLLVAQMLSVFLNVHQSVANLLVQQMQPASRLIIRDLVNVKQDLQEIRMIDEVVNQPPKIVA